MIEEVQAELDRQNMKQPSSMSINQQVSSILRKKDIPGPPSRKASSRRSVTIPKEKPLNPATLLAQKQQLYEGQFNTMAVFDSLPSMYTQEKWTELQQKRRCDLNFEHLYWLSRFDP